MGDFNENVRAGEVREMFDELEMVEAITSHNEGVDLPATYKHNQSGTIIDGIWATPGIQVQRAGYSTFGEFDHRAVWVDVQQISVFGHKVLPTTSITTRRLQMRLPKVVQRYQREYGRLVRTHKMAERVDQVKQDLYDHPSPEGFRRSEVIDEQRKEFMLAAERTCRKIHAGQVPFSPSVNTVGAEIRFLSRALAKRQGKKVSSRSIERLQKKTTLRNYPWHHTSMEDLHHQLQTAKKRYHLVT
jgi:hypothetical protein